MRSRCRVIRRRWSRCRHTSNESEKRNAKSEKQEAKRTTAFASCFSLLASRFSLLQQLLELHIRHRPRDAPGLPAISKHDGRRNPAHVESLRRRLGEIGI